MIRPIAVILLSLLFASASLADSTSRGNFRRALRSGIIRTAAGSICRSDRTPARGEIYKAKQSPHIASTDRRKFSTAMIYARGVATPSTNCISAYDASGRVVHRLGLYRRGEAEYAARFYGGSGCGDAKTPSQIARDAIKNSGYPTIFLSVGGGLCVRIPDPRSCYNSIGC